MANQDLISVSIPNPVVDTVKNNLTNSINALSPFIKALTKEQRQKLFKMGDGSTNLASKIAGYLNTNPEFTPSYLDKAKFDEDYALPNQLTPLLALVNQLKEIIDDTIMAAGSDIMDAGLGYYNSVRQAAKDGAPGAKAIYDDLKPRFPGNHRTTPPPTH